MRALRGRVLRGVAAALAAQEPAQNRREFTIVAKDHVFTPNKLDVSQDDLVKITLSSEDVPASFAIDAYRIVKRVAGKTSVTFEFRADQAGTFPFYCNLTTDAGCKDMKGVAESCKRNNEERRTKTNRFVIRSCLRYFLGNLSGLSVNSASTPSV